MILKKSVSSQQFSSKSKKDFINKIFELFAFPELRTVHCGEVVNRTGGLVESGPTCVPCKGLSTKDES